jgi:hypothetical protein
MTDPLPIVSGTTSLALGTITLLLNTITPLEQARRDYKDHSAGLEVGLKDCQQQLRGWKSTWGNFSDKTYKPF